MAVLVDPSGYDWSVTDGLAFWTLQGLSVEQPRIMNHPRIQPVAGLVDGFFVPVGNPVVVAYWRGFWQTVKGRNDLPDRPDAKGFLEVRPT